MYIPKLPHIILSKSVVKDILSLRYFKLDKSFKVTGQFNIICSLIFQPVHVDSNGLPLNVQDDGGGRVVTVMHPQSFPSHLCR